MTVSDLIYFEVDVHNPLVTFNLYDKLGYDYIGWFMWRHVSINKNNDISIYFNGECVKEYELK